MRKYSLFPSGNMSQIPIYSDLPFNTPVQFCNFIYSTFTSLMLIPSAFKGIIFLLNGSFYNYALYVYIMKVQSTIDF